MKRQNKKNKKYIITELDCSKFKINYKKQIIVLISTIISSCCVVYLTQTEYPILEIGKLSTYIGVLNGFAITIYVFGISLTENLENSISSMSIATDVEKEDMLCLLKKGFHKIELSIWSIFFSMVSILISNLIASVIKSNWDIEIKEIEQVINLSALILSTLSMYYIIKSLFNLSEIYFSLRRYK